MLIKNNATRITMSLLWIGVMLFMIFADIFSIIIELESGNIIQLPLEAKTTMLIAAVMVAIPILMIIASWVLPYKVSRLSNIYAGVYTILFVVGGGSTMPHYLVLASFEVLLLVAIIVISFKWKNMPGKSI